MEENKCTNLDPGKIPKVNCNNSTTTSGANCTLNNGSSQVVMTDDVCYNECNNVYEATSCQFGSVQGNPKCVCVDIKSKCGEYIKNFKQPCQDYVKNEKVCVESIEECNTEAKCKEKCEIRGMDSTFCSNEKQCFCVPKSDPPKPPDNTTCSTNTDKLQCPVNDYGNNVFVESSDEGSDYYIYKKILNRKQQLYSFCECDQKIKDTYDTFFGKNDKTLSKIWKEALQTKIDTNCKEDIYVIFKEKLSTYIQSPDGESQEKLNALIAYEMCRITNNLYDRDMKNMYPAFTQDWLEYYLSEKSKTGKIIHMILKAITLFIVFRILVKSILPSNLIKDPKYTESLFFSLFTNNDMFKNDIKAQIESSTYSLFIVVSIILFLYFYGSAYTIPGVAVYIAIIISIYITSGFVLDISKSRGYSLLSFVLVVLTLVARTFFIKEDTNKGINLPEKGRFTQDTYRRTFYYSIVGSISFISIILGFLSKKKVSSISSLFSYLSLLSVFSFAPNFTEHVDAQYGILYFIGFVIIGSIFRKYVSNSTNWKIYIIIALLLSISGFILIFGNKKLNIETISLGIASFITIFMSTGFIYYTHTSSGIKNEWWMYPLILFIPIGLITWTGISYYKSKSNKDDIDDDETKKEKEKEEKEEEEDPYQYDKKKKYSELLGYGLLTFAIIILLSIYFNNVHNTPNNLFISYVFTTLLGLLPLFISIVFINLGIAYSKPEIEILLLIIYRVLSFIPNYIGYDKMWFNIIKRPTDDWVIPFTPTISILLVIFSKLSGTPLSKYFTPTGYKSSVTNHELFMS